MYQITGKLKLKCIFWAESKSSLLPCTNFKGLMSDVNKLGKFR